MNQEEFIHAILPLRDRLFRIAWHITCNREEAEDIVQDVMIKVWNRGEETEKIENTAAYCYTMARNLALNRFALKNNQHAELEEGYRNTTEEGEQVFMYTRESKGDIAELVVLVADGENFTWINFLGKIDLKKISALTNGLNLEGMEQLGRLNEK